MGESHELISSPVASQVFWNANNQRRLVSRVEFSDLYWIQELRLFRISEFVFIV